MIKIQDSHTSQKGLKFKPNKIKNKKGIDMRKNEN